MQQYEIVIVLTPLLSEETAKEANAKYSKVLTDGGAEIVQEDNWGLRKLYQQEKYVPSTCAFTPFLLN
ncbi:MAG: ribosomal protein, partial [Mucilaginibacter sp.]|nr:ribosomal protein [Mucilaginibacter sp.]